MSWDSENTLPRGDMDNQFENESSHEMPLMERSLPPINSPYMAQEREMWRKMFLIFCVLLIAIIIGILSIY
jgi:hypothetical protein